MAHSATQQALKFKSECSCCQQRCINDADVADVVDVAERDAPELLWSLH